MKYITSVKNDWVKYIKSFHKKKYRHEYGLFLVEGLRNVQTTIEAGAVIDTLIIADSFTKDFGFEGKTVKVTNKVFDELTQTENNQGIMALVAFPELSIDFNTAKVLVYLDRVQDPGNMGTIIRTADSAGFDGVIVAKGSVDPFNDKVVRSAMGSLFAMGMELDCSLNELKEMGYSVVTTHLSGENFFDEISYPEKIVLVIGNEANGVSEIVVELSDTLVKIPMRGSAESLNAAVAAGIMMYEVTRGKK